MRVSPDTPGAEIYRMPPVVAWCQACNEPICDPEDIRWRDGDTFCTPCGDARGLVKEDCNV